ncbi:MAG: UDP-N-acetylmuramoyl-L-alanyl-D-glutamate--2,6-diaminopimelate ligase [Firmicutes bacterium]|nr:UDP-N-acetylmuramoyl-L-alanyl-D-glutamate--2,6-diaminopimelate ligase [Bacillota bacterium]
MQMGELAKSLPNAVFYGDSNVEVRGIAYDSRFVEPGDLFVCVKGFQTDGHLFAHDAVGQGAIGLVVETGYALGKELNVPVIQTDDTRGALALLSAAFYNYPSRRLNLIGVTGTNGKTTTTYLIKSILDTAGHQVGLLGGIKNQIGEQVLEAKRTTPESLDLQKLFSDMVQAGCDYAVMEVSSHAIALKRVHESKFAFAVFTNLSQDHLDFHGNLENYFRTKFGFFERLADINEVGAGTAIVNLDDDYGKKIARQTKKLAIDTATFGTDPEAGYRAQDIKLTPQAVNYRLKCPQGDFPVRLPLTGYFNVYNSLAALATAVEAGVPIQTALQGLAKARAVPGRLEAVDLGQDFAVLVDYAHTPDGLANVLETVEQLTDKRSILVFGCGGDRDKGKRPLMGEVAGRLADVVIVTSDNPRSEDPRAICLAIAAGVEQSINQKPFEVIVDRKEAINRAIKLAASGDIVVIAGKGHETEQIFKDQVIHFDDREVAADALREHLNQL